MRGRFITFEGGEGVGKTTQMELLRGYFEKAGHTVVLTREPGGTPGAEAVRHVLLTGAAHPFGTEMEAVLFAAARRDNVEQIVLPSVRSGRVVLCDRFMDSSRVYQGAVGGVPFALMDALEAAATEGAKPDLTLLLDLPVDAALERMRARQNVGADDRYEREDARVHELRRSAFLKIAETEPDRIAVIDASQDAASVHDAILRAVEERLG